MHKLIFALFYFLFLHNFANAEHSPNVLFLNGHLGKEEVSKAKTTIETFSAKDIRELIIITHSSSGDLSGLLDLAKSIYALKILKHLKVIVYIDDSAIGPAAIIPFLADELYVSLFASWGDIPLGFESYPANVLRNRVQSLIEPSHAEASLLTILAGAMADPLQQIDIKELKSISASGQTLVLNQNQLKELQLVKDILSLDEFQRKMHLEESVEKSPGFSLQSLSELSPDLQENLKKHISFNAEGNNQVGYLYVGDRESSINQSTWLYVKQGLDFYKQNKPIFIILELDTPGGEVFAAQKISDALKEMDTQYNIPVVAFINNWAISAGAMLAYSCRFITSVKDGSMGAAEPVLAGESGKMETASEKVNSALRSDFASRASFFNRNPLIAEAMVDKDLILVMRHGRIIKVDSESQIRTQGPEPDIVISSKGKLLTLNADQMREYGVADLILKPQQLPQISKIEKDQGEWPADKMLLFHSPFFSEIPHASVKAYQMDWKTRFFVFLASPLVSSLLFMGLLIGAYMELNHPGFGLPGIIAGFSLFLIILSSFSLELANWLELILLLSGLALILLELFVLPTMGILLLIGIFIFLAGLIGMLIPGINSVDFEYDTQTINAAGQFVVERLAWLAGAFILSGFIIVLLARYALPGFKGFNRLVLEGHEQEASKGYTSGYSPQSLPQSGAEGTVLATLRPAGKVLIKGGVFDAISASGLIESGEQIVVQRLDGNVIVVQRKSEP